MIRDTSLAAYRNVSLNDRQRDVMLTVWNQFTHAEFTRKELAHAIGWEINRVTPRVLELIDKGYLIELEGRRDGGHLLKINHIQSELFGRAA